MDKGEVSGDSQVEPQGQVGTKREWTIQKEFLLV